jgi:F-type H+-transporting ATPase subunit epsilon
VATERRKLDVSIVTPRGAAFEGAAEMVIVPGAAGEIGVLARHAPLVALLRAGSTRVHLRTEEEVVEFATGPGFFKVEQDRAIALVDDAVSAAEIDDDRARRQLEEAQAELERVERGESTADRWQLEQRIAHAENQLAVSGRWAGAVARGRRAARFDVQSSRRALKGSLATGSSNA